jgi:hypothetical protein
LTGVLQVLKYFDIDFDAPIPPATGNVDNTTPSSVPPGDAAEDAAGDAAA